MWKFRPMHNIVLNYKKGLTDHSPSLQSKGWSALCFLEEHQTQWPHYRQDSECFFSWTSSSSLVSVLHTWVKPSHMDLRKAKSKKLSFTKDNGLHAFALFTRCSCDVHGLEIAGLYHGNSQSTRSGKVTERKHQITKIHVILKNNKHKSHLQLFFFNFPLCAVYCAFQLVLWCLTPHISHNYKNNSNNNARVIIWR